MDVVVLTVQLDQLGVDVGTHAGDHLAKGAQVLAGQPPTPILDHEDQLHVEGSDDVPAWAVVVILSHRAHILSGMLVRYRYRINPTPSQRQALARAFGCARVVYNDALAERQRAFAAGEKLSDTEVQRRVVTLAKKTPERAWLAEIASVALVQACQDARRAYRNWFDSRSGRRQGRRVGRPRFRSKHGAQSIRLTRNGYAVHGTRLYVAKVGDLKVRWSRQLPSPPSSVTVILATLPSLDPLPTGIDLPPAYESREFAIRDRQLVTAVRYYSGTDSHASGPSIRRVLTWRWHGNRFVTRLPTTPRFAPNALAQERLGLEGLGPLRIGMTLGQAQAAVGGRITLQYAADPSCGQGAPRGAPDGLTVMFLDGRLARIDIEAPARIATLSGIRVGSSEAEVKRVYAGRIAVEPAPYNPSGHYLTYRPTGASQADRLLIFETDGRVVTSYRAGQREAVQLIEGCA
jgi:hypothetical protein